MAEILQAPPAASRSVAAPVEDLGTVWQRLTRGVHHFQTRADWSGFAGADWAERILDVQVTDDFHEKQGRSTGRWLLEHGGQQLSVYLKRHYLLPWWQGLLATLWPGGTWSPGVRERRNLLEAAAHGLPVPAVVAAGEWIGPRCKLQSFLAIEELVGMLPLHQAIPLAQRRLDPSAFCRWKNSLGAEMARLACLLHDRRCYHKDLYLCHFYIREADTGHMPSAWKNRVYVIDLHRLQHHPWTWPAWLVKDLGGLLFSSDVAGLTPRDRLLFWRAYWPTDGRSWRAQLLGVVRAPQMHDLSAAQ